MDPNHPYRPPASDVDGPSAQLSAAGAASITPAIVDGLRKTRPWVLLVAVMILVGCGLMVLAGLVMMAVGGIMDTQAAPLGGLAMGLIYLVMAALYLYPGVRLLKYAAAIKRIGDTDNTHAIELAIGEQQAFWRFVGIVTLVLIGIYILIFAVGIIAAIGMAAAS